MSRTCNGCSRPLRPNSRTGRCWKCNQNKRCSCCREPQKRSGVCRACKALQAAVNAIHRAQPEEEPGPAIRVYSVRALGL